MRIGLDVMGGDYAPDATLAGALLAREVLSDDITLVLFGDKNKIEERFAQKGASFKGFEIVPSTEVIEMSDHPAKAFSQKTQSSIFIGFQFLHSGKIDGFASAGSTGAMMVGAMYTVKAIPGVLRPTIATGIPKPEGKFTLVLDVGLNSDCKPEVLYQYGILGSLYAEYVYKIQNPRIGLLNIGSEEEKGNLLTKATFQLMKDTQDFNFIGNVEATELFDDHVDVLVCDGFVGNVVLKQAESFYKLIRKQKLENDFFARFNYENYGGTPVLGVNSNVIIGHGISNDVAIKNMILHTRDVINANLPPKIKQFFK